MKYVGLVLLVFGLALAVLSYANLYSWNIEVLDSGTLPIAANSSNEHSFYVGIGPMNSPVKKVEVIIDNGPWQYDSGYGLCVWITQSFQISLLEGQLNGQSSSVGITTATSPRIDYTFDVPSSWSALGGFRISNPENQPVSVNYQTIFHRQILNSSWQTAMFIGLIVAVIGIILMFMSIKKGRTSPTPSNS